MCNLYSITTNQAAILALFRVVNQYVGNLPPMPSVFPDYPAPVVRNTRDGQRELAMLRWGICRRRHASAAPPVTNVRNTASPHWRAWLKPESRCLVRTRTVDAYRGGSDSDHRGAGLVRVLTRRGPEFELASARTDMQPRKAVTLKPRVAYFGQCPN